MAPEAAATGNAEQERQDGGGMQGMLSPRGVMEKARQSMMGAYCCPDISKSNPGKGEDWCNAVEV